MDLMKPLWLQFFYNSAHGWQLHVFSYCFADLFFGKKVDKTTSNQYSMPNVFDVSVKSAGHYWKNQDSWQIIHYRSI